MEKDMTRGTPWKLILSFFVPLLVGNLFQQVYNLVDTIIVGKGISDSALAAVGSTSSLHFFVFGFVTGLTNGVAIPMAQAYGSGDLNRLKKVITMGLFTCMSVGILISVLSVAGSSLLLHLLNTPDDIFADARTYMVIIFGALFITVLYNFCACLLRALGDSRTPLGSIVISSVVNILLDLLFVIILKLGVAGAASATVIAQTLSVIFCLIRLSRMRQIIPRTEDWTLDGKLVRELFRLGLPVGCMNSVTAVGGMLLQYFVNDLGSAYTASYSACMKLFGFFEQPGTAIGMAVSTYVGQNYGAGEYGRVKQGVRSACVMTLLLSAMLGSIELFFPDQLVSLMLSQPETIALCRQLLPYGGLLLPALGLLFVFRYASLAMSRTRVPMLSGLLELFLRVILCLLLYDRLGYKAITIAEMSAWVGAPVMLGIYYIYTMRHLTHTS